MLKNIMFIAASSSLLFAAAQSHAESPWSIKVGASYITPKSDNGSLAGNTLEAEVSSEIGLTPSIEYAFSENIVGELLLAAPYEHDVDVTGGELVDSKVASFKHLPPTLSVKYIFNPDATFSPYAGIGLNYTIVFDENTEGALAGTELKGDESLGLALNMGLKYQIPDSQWGVVADVRYIEIESDLTLDGADIGTLEVDPLIFGISLSYDF